MGCKVRNGRRAAQLKVLKKEFGTVQNELVNKHLEINRSKGLTVKRNLKANAAEIHNELIDTPRRGAYSKDSTARLGTNESNVPLSNLDKKSLRRGYLTTMNARLLRTN